LSSNSSYATTSYAQSKWSSFGWARPNYANQFAPLQKLMKGKQWLFEPSPSSYVNSQYSPEPMFNNMRTPIMKDYAVLMIKKIFNWFRSQWIVATWVDKKANVTKLKTAKKVSLKVPKTTEKWREPIRIQKWIVTEFPLAKTPWAQD
jgi:hypothetical protein